MNIVDLDKLCEMFWDGNFMEIHKEDIPSIPSVFEGMTNGQSIMAINPNLKFCDGFVFIEENGKREVVMTVNQDWWNAPYKAESEV